MKRGRFLVNLFFIIILIIIIEGLVYASNNPISNCNELNTMVSNSPGTNYYLTKDIDCSGIVYNPKALSYQNFDGKQHIIRNVISRKDLYNVGFFSAINGSNISNLGLVNFNFSSCIPYVAGVSNPGNAGGLVGTTYGAKSRINNSYTKDGYVYTSFWGENTGGFIGNVDPNSVIVTNCYADNVTANAVSRYAGGFVGWFRAGSTINNSYSTGKEIFGHTGTGGTGGFVGRVDGGTCTNCFWDTQTSGVGSSGFGTGKTTAQMMQQSTFSGWDFINIWKINNGVDYPRFKWCVPNCTGKSCGNDGCGGSCGTCSGATPSCKYNAQCVQCVSKENCTSGQDCNLSTNTCFTPLIPGHYCSDTNQTIMKLSNLTNAHAALWNDTYYNYSLCFDDFFNYNYTKKIHDCNENNTPMFYLNSINNSHASIENNSVYKIPICFGNLTCRATSINNNLDGLVAYYAFEGNANDNSGNGNNGVLLPAGSGPTLSDGKYSKAYNFDGINDYIEITKTGSLNSNQFTISFWVKVDGPVTNFTHIISNINGSAGNLEGYAIATVNDTVNQGIFLTIANGSYTTGNLPYVIMPSIGDWDYITYSFNGNQVGTYENGVLKGYTTIRGQYVPSSNPIMRLGAPSHFLNSGVYFNGAIDNVKIWNRVLSSSEITEEYNSGCNSDEKTIVRLYSENNTHISNLTDVNYPIQICCKEFVPGQGATPGNVSWQDLNGNNITSANINDTVKLIIFRENVYNNLVNFDIYKKCDNIATCIYEFIFGRSVIAQLSSIGYSTWKANLNRTGQVYFNASVDQYFDVYPSYLLDITSYDNARPYISIVNPVENSTFIIDPDTNYTNYIPFNQISSDADDLLDVYWDFGDKTEYFVGRNCSNELGNCNTMHNYSISASGTRIVNVTAKESTRNQWDYNLTRIYVYKTGLNLFMIIDQPDYRIRQFPATPIIVDATRTHVANCSTTNAGCLSSAGARNCIQINDSVENSDLSLYCYIYADSTNPRFRFNWTIDGANKPEYPTNSSPFKIIFPQGGKHDVNLRVVFNMSS